MNRTEANYFLPENWDHIYQPVRCLKSTESTETWLLAERCGTGHCILKKAASEQRRLLRSESELLKTLAGHAGLPVPDHIDFWEDENFSYLLREYVPGRTLTELIEQEGPLPAGTAVIFAEKLCRHIHLFHSQLPPVIHRDIKPDNIVITDTGKIRLIDFETARNYKDEQEKDTVCMGTRGYAAPEQFGFGQTDARSDIYAIGKVLLYMLSGGCEDKDFEFLPAPGTNSLKHVILLCCAYDPARRYQNVNQIIQDLEKWQTRSSSSRRSLYLMAALTGIMSFALIALGIQNHKLKQQLVAAPENKVSVIETSGSSWNPYLFEEDVISILQSYQEGNHTDLAQKCEILVKELSENEQIKQVEPVAYWQLSGEELARYQVQRVGYEYIADRLAYNDYLIVNNLDSYEEYADQIAARIQVCLDYSWINEDGSQARSVLFSYTQGDDRNMDGCLIDLLSCIQQALE